MRFGQLRLKQILEAGAIIIPQKPSKGKLPVSTIGVPYSSHRRYWLMYADLPETEGRKS